MIALRLFLAALAVLFIPAAAAQSYILYVSPTSRALLDKDGVDLKTRVNKWRDLIQSRGERYTIVTHPAHLAQVPRASALILVSAAVLTDNERRVIAQRVDGGESLLATWMPDTLDENAAAVPPAFIEQVFKVKAKPFTPGERGFLITVGDTPVTYSIPAGTRVWVGTEHKYPTPRLATTGAGYQSDWSRADSDSGLIACVAVGSSRRVLLGYPESVWDPRAPEYLKIANLALDYVGGKPVAYLRTWPSPWRGAVTIGVDALWRFENVPRVAEVLTRAGIPASFHFLSPDAETNAQMIRDLVKAGHSYGGFGDATQPFAGQSEREQRTRVDRMVRAFARSLDGTTVGGLRAPQGATDAATEKAASSLDYLVDTGRVDSAVPGLASDHKLVLLPALNIDSNAPLDAINAGFDAAAKRARVLGGYAFVGIDAAGFQPGGPLEQGIERFAQVKGDTIWAASAVDVARWWRAHEATKVASQWDAASSALTLEVTAPDAIPFPLAIAIEPPPGTKTINVDVAEKGIAMLMKPDDVRTPTLVISAMPPGTHRLKLRFQP